MERRRGLGRACLQSFVALLVLLAPATAFAACEVGAYAGPDGDFVVLTSVAGIAAPGMRYVFRDGRRGSTVDADAMVTCKGDDVLVRGAAGTARWARMAFRVTRATFLSHDTELAAELIEPPGAVSASRPLVVLVGGSETTATIGSTYPYVFAAQGISVFVYDKRGTGQSGGFYTQNFELLADDAAAALTKAREVTAGRFNRAGFFGGSQGGWVAPLAATRSTADFVAVGFGLVASPIEEDLEQMLLEARTAKLDSRATVLIERLSRATARVVTSHFTEGFEELERVRRAVAGQSWAAAIEGEYSGAMLRMSDGELRRVGRPLFDNLELIWDYDAMPALQRLRAPLLWVFAEEDREAPIATTRARLASLRADNRQIDLYVFPGTDHGMYEFITAADGSRSMTRVTDGYFRLVADWIKAEIQGTYGRAQHVR